MKRDMDLVRSILKQTELADKPLEFGMIAHDGYSDAELAYHVELMQARGLLDASITKAWSGDVVHGRIEALTWDGLDYLDAVRSDRVWEKAKDAISKTVGSTTFGVIKTVCCKVAIDLITG